VTEFKNAMEETLRCNFQRKHAQTNTEKKTAQELDADTHVDILRQQLIRCLVLLKGIVIDTAASKGAAEEEAKESVRRNAPAVSELLPQKFMNRKWGKKKTNPPRSAPTGLRAGSGAAATASRRGGEE